MAAKMDILTIRRRWNVVCRSRTHLEQKLTDLKLKRELNLSDDSTLQRVKVKVDSLDADFKWYHFAVINVAEDNAQEEEQAVLDERDNRIAEIMTHIEELFEPPEVKPLVWEWKNRSMREISCVPKFPICSY